MTAGEARGVGVGALHILAVRPDQCHGDDLAMGYREPQAPIRHLDDVMNPCWLQTKI